MNNQDYNYRRNVNQNYNDYKSFDEMNKDFKRNNGNNNPMYQNSFNTNMYNTYVNKDKISSLPSKEKLRFGKILFIFVILFLIGSSVFIGFKVFRSQNMKKRTFMIYMVGSDLESKSMQGTYSISDIVGTNIDLENNNVVLIAGGSKKWHNFVSENEIGIYNLKEEGFEKVKDLPLSSMGSSNNLTSFLNYVYNNYKAENYDLIFWNHGLGSIGIEQDELSNDYLSISELDKALKNTNFKNKKLELTIFYNCLSSNLHMAKVMSKYSNYMVASEEIFYLSKVLNRLNFLEEVEVEDTGYDIGLRFIKQSDKVTNQYNDSHSNKIDSTLAIIDLKNIDELDKKVNKFFESVNLESNYYRIASIRRMMHTYGQTQTNNYDNVDLFELVKILKDYSNNEDAADKLLDEIYDTVAYSSSFNSYSNGLSIYFPYYGSDDAVETHLIEFDKLWNDSYINFITDFYDIRTSAKRAIRDKNGSNVITLKNEVKVNGKEVSLNLTEEEKEKYQYANFYIFTKDEDNKYKMLLKTNKVELENNTLKFKNNKLLIVNNKYISLVEKDNKYIYGTLSNEEDNLDVINYLDDNLKIVETYLDSKENFISSIVDSNDYNKMSLYNLKYDLLENGKLQEYFASTEEKEYIELDKNNLDIKLIDNNLNEYYVLFEVYDTYNDVSYSELTRVTK